MKNNASIAIVILMSLVSCDFNKSVSKNLETGMVTRGDGLSCEEVQITSGDEVVRRNTFIYGEDIDVDFENIEGFNQVDGNVFPGMSMNIITEEGDTILRYDDLYDDLVHGTNISALMLQSSLTAAAPIHSNNGYSLHIRIWDKKGEGHFTAELDFDVVPNEKILVESNHVSISELYLFSTDKEGVITDNVAEFNETIHFVFEGLDGFMAGDGMVYSGLSIVVREADGKILINEEDLMGESGMDYNAINNRLAPNFVVTGTEISNPVNCEITLWDKRSTARIKASAQLTIVTE
jgi:hypothetical protein